MEYQLVVKATYVIFFSDGTISNPPNQLPLTPDHTNPSLTDTLTFNLSSQIDGIDYDFLSQPS
jgi:hypothetical protein